MLEGWSRRGGINSPETHGRLQPAGTGCCSRKEIDLAKSPKTEASRRSQRKAPSAPRAQKEGGPGTPNKNKFGAEQGSKTHIPNSGALGSPETKLRPGPWNKAHGANGGGRIRPSFSTDALKDQLTREEAEVPKRM
ncbi:hypothetical protein CLCR_00346 [Cladophialophora carrionii]|uniref:Uncharacterized protein n=1 Tax=Cladophialophora carrionii TaxID=86049 RepID=A0A1C1D0T2_9EURO|nr:hypothetical protein CLCR_00346 [Cladophialophora carrionii]